jgi:hypothetical protein
MRRNFPVNGLHLVSKNCGVLTGRFWRPIKEVDQKGKQQNVFGLPITLPKA